MNELVQATFDYSVLSPGQAQRTQEAEYRLIGRTQKTIVENGRDLDAVKQDIGHGNFLNWIRSIGISESTADSWMAVAKNFGEIPDGREFENRALYLLSTSKVPESAREEAKQRAEEGKKITEEVAKQIRDAHKAREKAEEEAKQAREQLWRVQEISQKRSEQLNEKIAQLNLQIDLLSAQKSSVISPEAQEKIKKLTEQRDNLSRKVEELGKEAREATLKRNEEERGHKIRQDWQKTIKGFQESIAKLFSQLPTSVEMQVFEADDWERLYQAKESAHRFIAECENLSRSPSMIIESGEPFVYAVES